MTDKVCFLYLCTNALNKTKIMTGDVQVSQQVLLTLKTIDRYWPWRAHHILISRFKRMTPFPPDADDTFLISSRMRIPVYFCFDRIEQTEWSVVEKQERKLMLQHWWVSFNHMSKWLLGIFRIDWLFSARLIDRRVRLVRTPVHHDHACQNVSLVFRSQLFESLSLLTFVLLVKKLCQH